MAGGAQKDEEAEPLKEKKKTESSDWAGITITYDYGSPTTNASTGRKASAVSSANGLPKDKQKDAGSRPWGWVIIVCSVLLFPLVLFLVYRFVDELPRVALEKRCSAATTIGAMLLVVLLLWICLGAIPFYLYGVPKQEDGSGPFGDSFGFVNALFWPSHHGCTLCNRHSVMAADVAGADLEETQRQLASEARSSFLLMYLSALERYTSQPEVGANREPPETTGEVVRYEKIRDDLGDLVDLMRPLYRKMRVRLYEQQRLDEQTAELGGTLRQLEQRINNLAAIPQDAAERFARELELTVNQLEQCRQTVRSEENWSCTAILQQLDRLYTLLATHCQTHPRQALIRLSKQLPAIQRALHNRVWLSVNSKA